MGSGTILDVSPAPSTDEHAELEARGHQVVVCSGMRSGGLCSLVEKGACPVVDAADGVVFRMDLDEPYHRWMLRCYQEELGGSIPMRVVVTGDQAERHSDLLAGLPVSVGKLGADLPVLSSHVAMAAAVRDALGDPVESTEPTQRPSRHRESMV